MTRCAWCDAQFDSVYQQQIYCSVACRVEASKENAKRYAQISKYKGRVGKRRLCKSCGTKLSIYNDHSLCNRCHIRDDVVKMALKNIKDFIDYEQT